MVQVIRNQKVFLVGALVMLLIGLIFRIGIEKGDFIIWMSEHRTVSGDYFFRFMSYIVEPWFFMVLALFIAIFDYRHSILIGLSGIVTLVLSKFLKSIFLQPRPKIFFSNSDVWHLFTPVQGSVPLDGFTSFPSGHAMAAFALFTAISITVNRKKWMFLWLLFASISALSRVYLMNHFLEDILAGALIGIVITLVVRAIIIYWKLPVYNFTSYSIKS